MDAPHHSGVRIRSRSVVGIERILRRARLAAPRRTAPALLASPSRPSTLASLSTLKASGGFGRPRLRRTPSKAQKLGEGASWSITLSEASATVDFLERKEGHRKRRQVADK